jgi:hypothetical protein
MVEIFSPVLIHVWANQDGQVDFTLRPAQDSFAEWFSIGDVSSVNVAAGKETKLEWRVPEATGLWVLRASLNGGQAEATCEMRVVGKYIPQVNGVTLVPQLPCEDQMVTVSVRVWDEENVGINNVILFYRPAGEAGFREVPTTRIDDLTFQVTFSAPKDGGSEFYYTIIDVFNYPIYTMEQHHRAYSGFLTSGIDYEHTCTAYLIWPDYYLYGMDMMDTPPIVDNMEDCMAQCVDNLSCQSFTWDEAERGCQLKSGIPDPVLREQSISGMEYSVPAP